MIKVSLLVALAGLTASAKNLNVECIRFYVKDKQAAAQVAQKREAKELEKEEKRNARLSWAKDRPKIVNDLYFPMFVKQFETEFGVVLNNDYKAMFKRLLFDPQSLEPADWNLLRSGFPHDTTVGQENANGSLIKSYLNLNHLTIDKQEQQAEKILSSMRKKDVQLSQLEKVALRVARVIGRDYDFFIGTPHEVSEAHIRDMKERFLSIFSFAGKTLEDKEHDALFATFVTTDDPLSTFRYDISQVYDFKYKNSRGQDVLYVTNKMIEDRNERILVKAEKYKNPVLTYEINRKLRDPKLKKALADLNKKIESENDLAESLRYVRLMIKGQTGQQNPFKTSAEFGDWVEKQTGFFVDALKKLDKKGAKEKVKFLLEDMTEETLYDSHVAALKVKLAKSSLTKAERKDLIEFIESELGVRLFGVIRNEYRRIEPGILGDKKLDYGDLKDLVERNIGLLEETTALKRKQPDLFEAAFQFKLVRTGLTEKEVNEIFKIAQRNEAMRLASLIKFDPLAKYGFCFGRAYWFQQILEAHGVHPDSIGKVLVDGKMSGGLAGWAWHIAPTVEREGGGMWVLDQSHGEPQGIRKWFNQYRDHIEDGEVVQGASKDDRIKIFFTPGDRFGRQFWGAQDFSTMSAQYESIWNKFGADNKYFRDVKIGLEKYNFNDDGKDFIKSLGDQLLDALKIGF